jgi:hypothetical protein
MSGDGGDKGARGVLAYFGLETGAGAWEVLLWTAPYLAFLGVGLLGLSALVQWVMPLPLWVHGAAIALALVYFFLFLARVRRSAARGGDAPGSPGS